METSTQHFAEDPETLEEFVLGRMDPGTQALCEEHLLTCDTCKQNVLVERVIAAGIKRAGRDRLKERLGVIAGTSPSSRIPWPHVLSVAAVVAILIGIGITQRWFVTHVEPKDVAALEQPQRDEKSTAAEPQKEQGAPPQSATRTLPSAQRRMDAERRNESHDYAPKGGAGKEGYAPAPTDRIEEAPATETGKDKRRADMAQPTMSLAGGQNEFWANGTLLSVPGAKKEADEGKAVRSKIVGEMNAADAMRDTTDSIGRVVVEQRPVSKLPAALQNQQQFYSRQTIQTLVRQSEGETQLTLYPVSPFDSTQLHYARVQQVAPDSLVVQVGSQRIGYRFPPGTLKQGQTETGRAKAK
jgi:hypothetical protein